jgi:hypothetical protein
MFMVAHRQMVRFEAHPQRCCVDQLFNDRRNELTVNVALPALVHLLGRLTEVARVGDEDPQPGSNDCRGAGAGEAAEPADVGHVEGYDGIDIMRGQTFRYSVRMNGRYGHGCCVLLDGVGQLTRVARKVSSESRSVQTPKAGKATAKAGVRKINPTAMER